jgi:dihydroorotate dehydrogenase electron transfer subunit
MTNSDLPEALAISQIITENDRTKTFILDGSWPARPGQFAMVWRPGLEEKPFSLAGADPLRLTIAAVGPVSQALQALAVGDKLWLRGPLGRGYRLPAQPSPRILLVGGGYGVAPLLFLAQTARRQEHQVGMIIGAKSRGQLLLAEAFTALGVPLWLTTEDGSAGRPGLVTDTLARLMADPDTRPDWVYACGPAGMLAALARHCQGEAIPYQGAWEAHMRCGIGLCGSCELGMGWLVCLDGPVFSFDPALTSPEGSA